MRALAFVAALMLLAALLLTALYTVSVNPSGYFDLQARLNVAQRSGFTEEELRGLNRQVADSLAGGALSEADFSLRERLHMEDVARLITLCKAVMALCWAGFAAGLAALIFARRKRAAALLRAGFWQAFFALGAALAGVAIWAAVDFDSLFRAFHGLLFTNDLWLLSADTTLIRMFPSDFFQAIAARVGVRFLLMAAACAALGKGAARR